MKNSLALFVATLLCIQLVTAQSPQSIPFQAVARDTNGVLIPNQTIGVRITIHDGSATGTTVYQESQSVTTNNLGLLTLSIGQGSVITGAFSGISWASGPKFVQLEVDPSGGTTYTNLGTSQLQSVPYALYALSSGSTTGPVQAAGQIAYGNGTGTTSDNNFTHDSASGTTRIIAQPASEGTGFVVDSANMITQHTNASGNFKSVLLVGDGTATNLDTMCFFGGVADNSNNFLFGIVAVDDSVQIFSTDNNYDGGLVGSKIQSSYLDVSYDNGSKLNSLTVDSAGLHWEYNYTDVLTFPNTTDSGYLFKRSDGTTRWDNGLNVFGYDPVANMVVINYTSGSNPPAGFAVPNSAGVSFGTNYSQTLISAQTLGSWGSQLITDSLGITILNQDAIGDNAFNVTGAAPFPGWPFGNFGVYHVALNSDSSIAYGLVGTEDSTYILSALLNSTGGYGICGAHHYSAYMDVSYASGAYLNSLTEDSTGLHWEYQNSDVYTFPNADGSAGQVMSTDGSGHLTFTTITPTTTAWNAHQVLTGTGSSADTISLANNKNNIYNPGVTVTSLLVNLPGSPNDGDMFVLTLNAAVGSINFQNGTVASGVAGIAAGLHQNTYTYDAATTTWY